MQQHKRSKITAAKSSALVTDNKFRNQSQNFDVINRKVTFDFVDINRLKADFYSILNVSIKLWLSSIIQAHIPGLRSCRSL